MHMDTSLILADVIREKSQQTPDLDVLTFVHFDRQQQLVDTVRTYQQLWENGQKIAAGLDTEGMQQGDRFALIMLNHPEFVEMMVASSIVNTVYVPVDPRASGERLQYLMTLAACRGAVVADYALPALLEVADQLPELKWVWVLDTGHQGAVGRSADRRLCIRSLSSVLNRDVPEIEVRVTDPQQPMQLLFTSGTTGLPKAIVAPYARYTAVATLGEQIGYQPGDRPYTGLSLTHANAQLISLGNALYMGMRMVISRQFTKSRLWEILRRYECTSFNLLGGMTTAIYAEPARPDDAENSVRHVLSAGMPTHLWTAFAKRFNVEIFEVYAAAEGGLCTNPPGVGPIGSVGKPPEHMHCAILDNGDQEVSAGELGEICFRPVSGEPHPPVNYLNNPQASADKTRSGWFRSGDIGHKDEGGWVYFDYRDGDGIRRNGEFVDPALIEKAIAELDDVADVYVYGYVTEGCAPGEKEIAAAVVPVNPDSFDIDVLRRQCRQALPTNLVPTSIQCVEEIPKTASEKPLERVLRERLLAELQNMSGLSPYQ